jgi:mannosyltransferase OCH1-like enzyme
LYKEFPKIKIYTYIKFELHFKIFSNSTPQGQHYWHTAFWGWGHMTIPKIIHYCWLSDNPVPVDYQKYIKLWKVKLSDYQFILWDTKRFDINQTSWTRQAFNTGMYAYASDYIRFFAVYNHGGIYLDMDMEIVKPFDKLLSSELMLAYENHISENLEAGCFGAAKGHEFIKKCMEYYETNDFIDKAKMEQIMRMEKSERHDYIDPLISPVVMKEALEHFKDRGYKIYPREYFTAKNVLTGVIKRTKNTYTVHHFATQYHSPEWRKNRETEQKISRVFGEKTLMSRIARKIIAIGNRIARMGPGKAAEYYTNKYILQKM